MSNFFFQWIQVWTQCKDWERMYIYEIALLCKIFWELGKKSQKQPTKKPRAYWQFLSHLLSMSGLVLHFSFLLHCRFSVNYQKSVGAVKHPFIPYQHDCMSTNLAVGFLWETMWVYAVVFAWNFMVCSGGTSLCPDLSFILGKWS